jgi:hypothetical protein
LSVAFVMTTLALCAQGLFVGKLHTMHLVFILLHLCCPVHTNCIASSSMG